jgi:hypothetical protein
MVQMLAVAVLCDTLDTVLFLVDGLRRIESTWKGRMTAAPSPFGSEAA